MRYFFDYYIFQLAWTSKAVDRKEHASSGDITNGSSKTKAFLRSNRTGLNRGGKGKKDGTWFDNQLGSWETEKDRNRKRQREKEREIDSATSQAWKRFSIALLTIIDHCAASFFLFSWISSYESREKKVFVGPVACGPLSRIHTFYSLSLLFRFLPIRTSKSTVLYFFFFFTFISSFNWRRAGETKSDFVRFIEDAVRCSSPAFRSGGGGKQE